MDGVFRGGSGGQSSPLSLAVDGHALAAPPERIGPGRREGDRIKPAKEPLQGGLMRGHALGEPERREQGGTLTGTSFGYGQHRAMVGQDRGDRQGQDHRQGKTGALATSWVRHRGENG